MVTISSSPLLHPWRKERERQRERRGSWERLIKFITEESFWEMLSKYFFSVRSPCFTQDIDDKCRGWGSGQQSLKRHIHTEDVPTVRTVLGGSFCRSIPSCLQCKVKKEKRVKESLANPIKMDGRDWDKSTCRHCVSSNSPAQKQTH